MPGMKRLGLGLFMPLLPLILCSGGCVLYFGDDTTDDCQYGAADITIPANQLRNPQDGTCQYYGGGGGCPTPATDPIAPGAWPDWAQCYAGCEGLDEYTCQISDGCRAIYTEAEACGPDGTCSWVRQYADCWGVAPSGPITGGLCEGLDAQTCSEHNDCSAVHDGVTGVPGAFKSCITEPLPCAGTPGGGVPYPGMPLLDPYTGKCEDVGGGGCLPMGGGTPPPTPPGGGGSDGIAQPDWASCTNQCQDLDEATCKASDGCRAIYADACPPWADCFTLQYKACWPTAPTGGPIRGGDCSAITDAYECSRHDDCVANHASDWSGCMDPNTCAWTLGGFLSCGPEATPPPPPPPPAPVCADITTEALCIDMADGCTTNADGSVSCGAKCQPLYEGSDCSCNPMGCTCTIWTWVSCTDAS
jgi:hypothetical protein